MDINQNASNIIQLESDFDLENAICANIRFQDLNIMVNRDVNLNLETNRNHTPNLDGIHQNVSNDTKTNDNSQNNIEAIMNLLNNCLGTAILGMPYAFSQVGIIGGIIFLILSAQFNRYSLLKVIYICKEAHIPVSYVILGNEALGQYGKLIVIVLFTCMGYFCLVSYLVATKDSIEKLISDNEYVVWSLTFTLNVILTQIRKLKKVALFSTIAFISCILLCIVIIIDCSIEFQFFGLEQRGLKIPSFDSINEVLPIFILTCSIQAGGSIILGNLEENSTNNRKNVSYIAFSIVFFLNSIVSIFAMLRFGDHVSGDVMNSFSRTDYLANIGRFLLMILVILSYMFMIIPCKVAISELILGKNETMLQPSWTEFIVITSSINLLACIAAQFLKNLKIVISINGSFTGSLIAFVCPAIFEILILNRKGIDIGLSQWVHNVLLILIGFYVMITGLGSVII